MGDDDPTEVVKFQMPLDTLSGKALGGATGARLAAGIEESRTFQITNVNKDLIALLTNDLYPERLVTTLDEAKPTTSKSAVSTSTITRRQYERGRQVLDTLESHTYKVEEVDGRKTLTSLTRGGRGSWHNVVLPEADWDRAKFLLAALPLGVWHKCKDCAGWYEGAPTSISLAGVLCERCYGDRMSKWGSANVRIKRKADAHES